MEDQCVGKPFWHPKASRLEAEKLLRHKPPGSFVIRRSSKVGCLALSHKLPNHSYGHALILFDGSGYMLEQADRVYARIEALVKSLDLKLDDEKSKPPRPTHVLDNKLVLFQAEVLCTYNHVVDGELDATRGDYVNVYGMEGPHYLCELNGKGGLFPIGLSKKVAGSEAGVPTALLQREEAKAFKPGEQALPPTSNYMSTSVAHMPPNYTSAAPQRPSGRSFPSMSSPARKDIPFGVISSAPTRVSSRGSPPPALLSRSQSQAVMPKDTPAMNQRPSTAPNSPLMSHANNGVKTLPSTPPARSNLGNAWTPPADAKPLPAVGPPARSSGAELYSAHPSPTQARQPPQPQPPIQRTSNPPPVMASRTPQPQQPPQPQPPQPQPPQPQPPQPQPPQPQPQQQQQPEPFQPPQPQMQPPKTFAPPTGSALPSPLQQQQPPQPVQQAPPPQPIQQQPPQPQPIQQQPPQPVPPSPQPQPPLPIPQQQPQPQSSPQHSPQSTLVVKPSHAPPTQPSSSIDDPSSPDYLDPRKRCQVCNVARAVAKVTMASGLLVKMCQECIQREREKKAAAAAAAAAQDQQQQQPPPPQPPAQDFDPPPPAFNELPTPLPPSDPLPPTHNDAADDNDDVYNLPPPVHVEEEEEDDPDISNMPPPDPPGDDFFDNMASEFDNLDF